MNDPPTALVGFKSARRLACRPSMNNPPTALVGLSARTIGMRVLTFQQAARYAPQPFCSAALGNKLLRKGRQTQFILVGDTINVRECLAKDGKNVGLRLAGGRFNAYTGHEREPRKKKRERRIDSG